MELTLKSNNQESLAKIIALAKKLNVVIEKKDTDLNDAAKDALRSRILNFKAKGASSFGDAGRRQRDQREDRLRVRDLHPIADCHARRTKKREEQLAPLFLISKIN